MSSIISSIPALPSRIVTNAFTQLSTVTVANSIVETSLIGSGVGSLVFPANYFTVGKTLRINANGFHSSVANPDITIKVKLNSTIILNSEAVASHADVNSEFIITGEVCFRTIGQNGTIFAQGVYTEAGPSSNTGDMVNTAAITINTTIAQTLTITAQWGTASNSNTISLTNLRVDVCG